MDGEQGKNHMETTLTALDILTLNTNITKPAKQTITPTGIQLKAEDMDFDIIQYAIPKISSTIDKNIITIHNKSVDRLKSIKITLNGISLKHKSKLIKPCYEMVGSKITPEQATDIIMRSDSWFEDAWNSDNWKLSSIEFGADGTTYVGGVYSEITCLTYGNSLNRGFHGGIPNELKKSWVGIDGTIYERSWLDKPSLYMMLVEWIIKLYHFPYLSIKLFLTNIEQFKLQKQKNIDFSNSIELAMAVSSNKIAVFGDNQNNQLTNMYNSVIGKLGNEEKEKHLSEINETTIKKWLNNPEPSDLKEEIRDVYKGLF